ncbi:low molecular weight phosphatase family protein [Haloferax mediterranei ATCC 33500]|uniref:ArsC family transcriptional regulator n=1 Tax=Haloferax mediterranei (strain ATCC 33500 / DSM 1411 / JCM 8866 / NBRC 14739 / NCIMB 2177 / R-4) TaxID=523841 RepID=I3R108_HALMT|nr:ArsC family transcriptional regulator [Haloferax mediterranei]AFK17918.1 arsenate reductase (glutaredoxin), protein-tyrosine-phosphatase [Haloferax mediterranei ATCC 33500]AHZ22658.1 ArsC family transcriptional regulator [Haloferax mediterranei ATCC 33500]EMA02807.1 arsenate reductase (glutaredoxin), protein-tyrosine-phosphatase [Haloferax mediterranei ATCC 33500]MDX5988009.1 low molecular weight phosphatase family protein [Haloferax mediterranei ATCC 33500]QCQ74473.1 low molecular weight p
MSEQTRIAFVCVQNAGRSQMATAFARRERDERDVGDRIDIVTGGTDPADHVHDEVVEVMSEDGFSLENETPRAISQDDIMDVDIVVTMGCSAEGICPMTWRGDARDWALDDPDGQELDAVREIRDDIERRVSALFDEVVGDD